MDCTTLVAGWAPTGPLTPPSLLAVLSALAGWPGASPPTATTDPPPSAAVLATLPDGPEKRKLLLDCTGCHQLGVELAYPQGRPRNAASWDSAVSRMLGFAGAQSSFPIISPEHRAPETARYLARHLRRAPTSYSYGPVGRDAEIREYDYPYPQDLPHDVAVDRAGKVLITGMFTHRILVLDPETGRYDEIPIPVPSANPRAIDIDRQGTWWVLLGAPGRVASYVPATRQWSSWEVGMYGHSIQADTAARVWFNGHFTSDPVKLGYVDAGSGQVRLFDIPTPPALSALGPIPYELRVADDGTVWGTDLRGNRIYALDPDAGTVRAWNLPITHAGPRRADPDAKGRLWIPAYAANLLLRFDPATERFVQFRLPIQDALPYIARVDRVRNRIWVATAAADALLLFDQESGRFTVYPLPTRGALVRHLAIDERTGDVWAPYGASPGIPPRIARLRLRADPSRD